MLVGVRGSAALPFAVVGVTCVVAGGLVAAATAPAPSEHASWAAAYLVGLTSLVEVGGALLAVALALLIRGVGGARQHGAWPLYTYRVFVIILLVSIPIGLLLARAGPT